MLTVVLLCLLVCIAYAVREQIKARSTYKLPPSLPGELPIIGHTHILIVSGTKDPLSFIKRISMYAVDKGGIIYWRILRDLYYGDNFFTTVITDPEDALTVANSCLQKPFIYDFAKNWIGQGFFTSTATTFGSNIKDVSFMKNYSLAVDEMMEMYTKRFAKAYLHSDLIYTLLGHKKKEDILINTLTKLTNEVIQNKKAALKNDKTYDNHPDLINNQEITNNSMVDYMLEMDGLLTDEEIKEELDTNIIASYDTISHTLINILVLLGSHPDIQERIYEELIKVLGADRDVEKTDLQKLVYTKAVIKETLRVLPTGTIFARYIDRAINLKKYTLPAKSYCMIIPYGIHRSPAWGSDVDHFKPERWLDPASLPSDSNYFAAFSMGKRSCIGMTYAITQLSVALIHFVRQYKWTADFTRAKMQWFVTLHLTEGHEIRIERRITEE